MPSYRIGKYECISINENGEIALIQFYQTNLHSTKGIILSKYNINLQNKLLQKHYDRSRSYKEVDYDFKDQSK